MKTINHKNVRHFVNTKRADKSLLQLTLVNTGL